MARSTYYLSSITEFPLSPPFYLGCFPQKTNRSSSLFTAEELLQELSTNEDEEHGRIVLGRWRDSGTSCWDAWFRHGYCHASVVTSCCCTPCAAGQVATRLHVTPWSAQPITHVTVGRARVFATIVQWCAVYWMSRLALLVAIACLDPYAVATVVDNNSNNATPDVMTEPGVAYYVCCAVDDLLVWLYVIACAVQLRNLRRTVRQQYQIPASTACGERWEDTVCAVFCPCWVAAQLLRHTANYDHERPARWPCCSATGLAPVVAV